MRKRAERFGKQNLSDAVMAQRGAADDERDDFPTPPWATRAFITKVLPDMYRGTVCEPAAGRGYMAEVLKERFETVDCFDAADYGYCPALSGGFLENERFSAPDQWDWVISNPPFKLAKEFVERGLHCARRGVAMLCRTVIIEGQQRYEALYSRLAPSLIAQYVERVPMVEGQYDPRASTATGYAWVVWDKTLPGRIRAYPNGLVQAPLCWIPPCRAELERSWERINALLLVADNERRKMDEILLGVRDGDPNDCAAKAMDRQAAACKELEALYHSDHWKVTRPLLRDTDGRRLSMDRIKQLINERK